MGPEDEAWTQCELCKHCVQPEGDYPECGLDLGNIEGGGVPFECPSFDPDLDNPHLFLIDDTAA